MLTVCAHAPSAHATSHVSAIVPRIKTTTASCAHHTHTHKRTHSAPTRRRIYLHGAVRSQRHGTFNWPHAIAKLHGVAISVGLQRHVHEPLTWCERGKTDALVLRSLPPRSRHGKARGALAMVDGRAILPTHLPAFSQHPEILRLERAAILRVLFHLYALLHIHFILEVNGRVHGLLMCELLSSKDAAFVHGLLCEIPHFGVAAS
mmetsp:Transcript_8624/g.19168  ORF Transcript_8624/g.19168 Transcript_8624/m.19168 type:complete len:205 (-) Transcript_8624:138-752(-)